MLSRNAQKIKCLQTTSHVEDEYWVIFIDITTFHLPPSVFETINTCEMNVNCAEPI